MTTNRIIAAVMSCVLFALLAWSIYSKSGDTRTLIMVSVGAVLGLVYAMFGRLPGWVVALSGSSITDDDDPSNIPARVYLPILLGVIVTAVVAFVVVIRFL